MSGWILHRTFEPSRIRRGRMATSPVWILESPEGERTRFMRKRDADKFIEDQGVCVHPDHAESRWGCRGCLGTPLNRGARLP